MLKKTPCVKVLSTVLLYCISDVTWLKVVSGVLKDSRTRGSNHLKKLAN